MRFDPAYRAQQKKGKKSSQQYYQNPKKKKERKFDGPEQRYKDTPKKSNHTQRQQRNYQKKQDKIVKEQIEAVKSNKQFSPLLPSEKDFFAQALQNYQQWQLDTEGQYTEQNSSGSDAKQCQQVVRSRQNGHRANHNSLLWFIVKYGTLAYLFYTMAQVASAEKIEMSYASSLARSGRQRYKSKSHVVASGSPLVIAKQKLQQATKKNAAFQKRSTRTADVNPLFGPPKVVSKRLTQIAERINVLEEVQVSLDAEQSTVNTLAQRNLKQAKQANEFVDTTQQVLDATAMQHANDLDFLSTIQYRLSNGEPQAVLEQAISDYEASEACQQAKADYDQLVRHPHLSQVPSESKETADHIGLIAKHFHALGQISGPLQTLRDSHVRPLLNDYGELHHRAQSRCSSSQLFATT